MADLDGRSVVVLESRMPSQLAKLFERHGGRAISAPALREVPLSLSPEVTHVIDEVCAGEVEMVIFLTGVGAKALLNAADSQDKLAKLLRGLNETKIVCRGPKPVAVMRANSVHVDLVAPTPFTSEFMIASIRSQGWDLRGKTVALQHYGEINAYVKAELSGMGAKVLEVSLYEWALPENVAPLEGAIRAMIEGSVDAIAFTTQSQVRHLFQIADRMGLKDALKDSMREKLVVAPVGPVCVRALANEGIIPHVVPKHPKMGPLVLAIADHFARGNAL